MHIAQPNPTATASFSVNARAVDKHRQHKKIAQAGGRVHRLKPLSKAPRQREYVVMSWRSLLGGSPWWRPCVRKANSAPLRLPCTERFGFYKHAPCTPCPCLRAPETCSVVVSAKRIKGKLSFRFFSTPSRVFRGARRRSVCLPTVPVAVTD